MNIRTIKHYSELNQEEPTVLVLGYFDGIHLGHKALLDRARQVADEKGLSVTVLTFPETPRLAFARFTPRTFTPFDQSRSALPLVGAIWCRPAGFDRFYQ